MNAQSPLIATLSVAVFVLMGIVYTALMPDRLSNPSLPEGLTNEQPTHVETVNADFLDAAQLYDDSFLQRDTLRQEATGNCVVLEGDKAFRSEKLLDEITNSGRRLYRTRVAFVVGNQSYLPDESAEDYENRFNNLGNAGMDAVSVARALTAVGFQVHLGVDLNYDAFEECKTKFLNSSKRLLAARNSAQSSSGKASQVDAMMFYYAGHGITVGGKSYVLPVDATIDSAAGEAERFVEVLPMLREMRTYAGASFLFLDACRNTPFTAKRLNKLNGNNIEGGASIENGLETLRAVGTEGEEIDLSVDIVSGPIGPAPLAASDEQGWQLGDFYYAYATFPSDVASDGESWGHSPFTQAFLDNVAKPGQTVPDLLAEIGRQVRTVTNGRQQPWGEGALTREFYINGDKGLRDLVLEVEARGTESFQLGSVTQDRK